MRRGERRVGHTVRQWEIKFFVCGCQCYYCLRPLTLAEATKDHQVPRSKGGGDEIDNIVPACFHCNIRKGKKTEEEFRASSKAFSKAPPGFTALDSTSFLAAVAHGTALELLNEPNLMRKLRRETEETSWAWRNPA